MISRRTFTRTALTVAGAHLIPGCKLVADSALAIAQLESLVTALEGAGSRRAAIDAAGEHLLGGGGIDDLYRALLVACCRQLSYDPLGFVAHPLWTVAPAAEIGRRGTGAEAVVAALHAVELFKLEQRTLRGESHAQPGELGALPTPDPAALEQAIHDGDADGADLAAVALFRAGDRDLLRLTLGRSGLHDVGGIGHVQIHVAQTLRALDELGWDETVVRVIAWGLGKAAAGEFAVLAPWDANQALADALPATWDRGAVDSGGALALVASLRTRDSEAACAAVAAALADGLGVASVFDALNVRASELSLSHIGLNGVFPGLHSVTGLDAFRWIFASTVDDATRRRAVLQAAAMIVANDVEGDARSGGGQADVRLDALEPLAGASAEEVLETASDDRLAAAAQLLALVRDEGPASFIEAQRSLALRATVDEHNFKLPVAAWLAAEVAAPELTGAVLAGTLGWGSTALDRDWDLLDRAREIAADVG